MKETGVYSIALALLVISTGRSATFIPLGDFPSGIFSSGANEVSGDGKTIVGAGVVNDAILLEAARWTENGEILSVSDSFFEDVFESRANAVSADGNVIAGTLSSIASGISTRTSQAFRWTEENGVVSLGTLPNALRTTATDVSGDGDVVIGNSTNAEGFDIAFIWNSDDGIVSLGTLATDLSIDSSRASAISSDGKIIVGTSNSQAFRWTEETGIIGLGSLPGGFNNSSAEHISSDGSTIVGSASSELSQGSTEAYRWTSEVGIQGLGFLNTTDFASTAEFTSSDGRLVFGFAFSLTANNDQEVQFYVWDPVNNMRDLREVLENEYNLGTALAGWTQFRANDISDDGLSLVGSGINPDGNPEAWLIQLRHPIGVPEPNALILCLSFTFIMLRRSRQTA